MLILLSVRTMRMTNRISLQRLRRAIPEACFRPCICRSAAHILADMLLAGGLALAAHELGPRMSSRSLRILLWMTYGYIQGLVFTGIWILAHECGHYALFPGRKLNDAVGFVLHSALLVPYFSWKYTHARHHRFTNHMERDTAYVPSRVEEKTWSSRLSEVLHQAEDTPLHSAIMLVCHQLFGWQAYVACYASGGSGSFARAPTGKAFERCLLNPSACIFTESQAAFVVLSSLGLVAMLSLLTLVASKIGWYNVALLYGLPYVWVNNWLVAITYLHHTHRDIQHFSSPRWTYIDGALSTVDRPLGIVGRHVFHGIVDFHVVHHLFPQIPFYHAEEATEAIRKELGGGYLSDDTPFWIALWRTFRECQVVIPSKKEPDVLVWRDREA
ncbi:Oleate hydroxylase FAH12 [Pseudocercospora fuligena]|uniref:Oleate hydroxylase FAH12 n=1 Tax=Pseudocercospora fuligena TaxID=685502 RepID=A0A8H6VFQ3_9PEZI|nr:Oleate hydroxylase FAH12 [Pseudocercospora fuligena]